MPEAHRAVLPVRALALIVALTLAGCSVGVAPWQRGFLAEPAMQLGGGQVDSQLERQYYVSREAGRGGNGFGGTGCGCN